MQYTQINSPSYSNKIFLNKSPKWIPTTKNTKGALLLNSNKLGQCVDQVLRLSSHRGVWTFVFHNKYPVVACIHPCVIGLIGIIQALCPVCSVLVRLEMRQEDSSRVFYISLVRIVINEPYLFDREFFHFM